MTLEQLRIFVAVLDSGSFSRSAQTLGIGQSTVSFHIAELERSLGAPVFDRRRAGVRPTPAGRALSRDARRMLGLHDEALGRLRAEIAGEGGRIVIAASTIPGEYLLPIALEQFRATHPRVEVRVEISDSRRALGALLAEECDFALVGARAPGAGIVYSAFAHDEILLVGPAPNPFAPSGRLTPERLAAVPLVLREAGSGTQQTVEAGVRTRAKARPEGAALLRVGSSEAVKQCVRRGLGLGYLSRWAVAEDLAAGRLTEVRMPGLPIARRFHVAHRRGVTLSAAARALHRVMLREIRFRRFRS